MNNVSITPDIEEVPVAPAEERATRRSTVDVSSFFTPTVEDDPVDSPSASTTTASYSSLLAPEGDLSDDTPERPSRARSADLSSVLSPLPTVDLEGSPEAVATSGRERYSSDEPSEDTSAEVEERPPKFMLTMVLTVCACLLALSGLLILLSDNKPAETEPVIPDELVMEELEDSVNTETDTETLSE